MIESAVRNLVIPTSSSIPEIGSRLYIGSFPDKLTYPAVVMYSEQRFEDMFESDIKTERIKFFCYANYLSSATLIAISIRDILKRYYGAISTEYQVINTWFDSMSYVYDNDVLKYIRILDMNMRYI